MVVCQPGITDVAKSIDTIVCTDNTRGVEIPAKIKATTSYLPHDLADPFHPIAKKPYQNTSDTDR